MKENLTLTRRTAVALSDCLMLFLGLYGTVFCLVTAFSLPVDYRTITMTCLVCAPLFTAVFALPWYWSRVALYLGCAAAVGITAWRWLDLLKLGGLVLARQVVNTFAWALGSSVTLDITVLTGETTLGQEAAAITALFLLLTVAVAFWIGWLWQRMRSFWLTFWGTFPLLVLPLSVTVTPGWVPLLMLLLFWGVGLLVRQANKTDLSGSAKTVLMVLPLCALLLAGLGNVLPREDYEQTGWAEEARLEIIDRLAAVGRGVTSAGADLGLASGTDQIDLSQAGPLDFDGDTALRVRSQTTGHIYLRGFSSAIYTGGGWEQLSDEVYQQMQEGWEMSLPGSGEVYDAELSEEPFTVDGIGAYQPINFPAMADPDADSIRIEVENVGAAERFVYTPYQLSTTPDRMSGAEFVGDAYLARGTGVWTYVLYARETASPIGARLTGDVSAAEQSYRLFVYNNYLQIPEELKQKIDELTQDMSDWNSPVAMAEMEANLDQGVPYPVALGRYIGAYLASIATYDPDTPAAPDGTDFVTHFLNEGRGYCMHFATTATLMLRSIGLPARYVSGYVADTVAGEWVDVPDYNAHAWVEVYLAGYGWQPVEVTPGYDGTFAWEKEQEETPEPTETQTPEATPAPTHSQAPLPTWEPETPEEPAEREPLSPMLWLLAIPAVLVLAVAGLVLRRRLAERSRARKFGQTGPNRAVIEMYLYAEKVAAHTGGTVDPVLESLAKKAAFSAHVLTAQERETARTLTEQAAQAADRSRGRWNRLVFRYILGLY